MNLSQGTAIGTNRSSTPNPKCNQSQPTMRRPSGSIVLTGSCDGDDRRAKPLNARTCKAWRDIALNALEDNPAESYLRRR